MPTAVNIAKQCLTAEAGHVLDESVNVARKRGHTQTTSLHTISALLSLPSSVLRDACSRVRNSTYSPRLQFKALDLCLSVSLDRIQSGQATYDPPISNSLMAAIKRSQAHQRRLPENFRVYQNTVSCVKVELRQLILSILDDPVVSRIFGEAGFRSSELKLSIIRPIPHVLRYSNPRGQPLFLCNVLGNQEIAPIRWGFNITDRNLNGDVNYRSIISTVLISEKRRNPLLVGVSAYDVLTEFLNSLEEQTNGILPTGLNVVNIGLEIAEQIEGKFDKNYIDIRFCKLGKLVENCLGGGVILNYGDLKVFNNGNTGDAASYVVDKVSELLQRHRRRIWLIGSAASEDDYEKLMRKFRNLEKDWDLKVLNVTSLRHSLPHHSSLMGSFVPFGGFFSTPELKFNKEITGLLNTEPVSSISNQNQSTLPPWLLQMTPKTGLNQQFGVKTKEGLESVFGDKSTSSGSNSVGSAKSVTADLNLRICSVTRGSNLKKHIDNKYFPQIQSTSSCIDNSRDINGESFKIIYRRLTETVSGQEEAARLISSVLSQPPKISSTRRDVWLNLIGPDTIGKRKMALLLAEIVYQSEHRSIAVDLSEGNEMGGCDDAIRLRGKTMIDHIFEVMCRNPFCVVFLENIEKADEKLQISLLKAIETSKFMDSHGREVGIGNTMFVMTSSSSSHHYEETSYSKVGIQDSRSVSGVNSMNKRKMMDCRIAQGKKETAETGKRMNRASNGVLDLNLPAQETEIEEKDCFEENSKVWLVKFKNHERLIEVPFKRLGFGQIV